MVVSADPVRRQFGSESSPTLSENQSAWRRLHSIDQSWERSISSDRHGGVPLHLTPTDSWLGESVTSRSTEILITTDSQLVLIL